MSLKLMYKFNYDIIKQFNGSHYYMVRSLGSHSVPKDKEKIDLNIIINYAEKVVGYPTSFLNLRFLLSDEFANMAYHLRKLIGTSHPLLQTTRNIIMLNEKPTYSLIVLLISKAGGLNRLFPDVEIDSAAGILHSQRSLAEVCDMLRTSHLIHKSLVNFRSSEKDALDMNYGNKVALLCGDYILSNCYHTLACIKNQPLNELMSSALRDLVESDFLGPRDSQNNPMPCKPVKLQCEQHTIPNIFGVEPLKMEEVLGKGKAEWTLRTLLSGGTLLGKSCQGALKLAGHSEKKQEKAYVFGRNVALAWQAHKDRDSFVDAKSNSISLVSAPVLFHLQHDPDFYAEIQKGVDNVGNVDYGFVRKRVADGPALEQTRQMQEEYSKAALCLLEEFPVEDARIALANIINSFNSQNG